MPDHSYAPIVKWVNPPSSGNISYENIASNNISSGFEGFNTPPGPEFRAIPQLVIVNTKLDPYYWDLFQAVKRGELVDGKVRVEIHCVPVWMWWAARAVNSVGGKVELSNSQHYVIQALVPITSLDALANARSITSIQRPVMPGVPSPPTRK